MKKRHYPAAIFAAILAFGLAAANAAEIKEVAQKADAQVTLLDNTVAVSAAAKQLPDQPTCDEAVPAQVGAITGVTSSGARLQMSSNNSALRGQYQSTVPVMHTSLTSTIDDSRATPEIVLAVSSASKPAIAGQGHHDALTAAISAKHPLTGIGAVTT